MLVSVSSRNARLFHLNRSICSPDGLKVMGKFITCVPCVSFTFQKCIKLTCNKYCRLLFPGLRQIFYFLIIDALLRDTLAECYASDTCCLAWILNTCEVVSLSVPAVSFVRFFSFSFFFLNWKLIYKCTVNKQCKRIILLFKTLCFKLHYLVEHPVPFSLFVLLFFHLTQVDFS